MKKISYILISGILGLIISSCDSNSNSDSYEYKTKDLKTATLGLGFDTSNAKRSFDICFELKSDVKTISAFNGDIGDFKSDTIQPNKFCKKGNESNEVSQTILIPKSFKYVYYKNGKAIETIDHTSGKLTYTVKIGNNSEIDRTFEVTPEVNKILSGVRTLLYL